MITAAIKDKILSYICANTIPETVAEGETDTIRKDLEFDFNFFKIIGLLDFYENGILFFVFRTKRLKNSSFEIRFYNTLPPAAKDGIIQGLPAPGSIGPATRKPAPQKVGWWFSA